MNRPPEYDNLIKTGALQTVDPTPGAVEGFLAGADGFLILAQTLRTSAIEGVGPTQIFTNAYEGYHNVVQAVLEHFQVRTKDAGRNVAIQRASADLKLGPAEMDAVIRAHQKRNATTYRSPFPPVSKAEASTMVSILAKALPVARLLTTVDKPVDEEGAATTDKPGSS